VADGANKRIEIFSPEGDFLGLWTDMGGPNDITRGEDGGVLHWHTIRSRRGH
jgi:hypothetical protein